MIKQKNYRNFDEFMMKNGVYYGPFLGGTFGNNNLDFKRPLDLSFPISRRKEIFAFRIFGWGLTIICNE